MNDCQDFEVIQRTIFTTLFVHTLHLRVLSMSQVLSRLLSLIRIRQWSLLFQKRRAKRILMKLMNMNYKNLQTCLLLSVKKRGSVHHNLCTRWLPTSHTKLSPPYRIFHTSWLNWSSKNVFRGDSRDLEDSYGWRDEGFGEE